MRFEEHDATFYAVEVLDKFVETAPEIYRQHNRLLIDILNDPESGQMLQDLRKSKNADCIRIAEAISSTSRPKSTDRIHYDILEWEGKPSKWLMLIHYRLQGDQRPLIITPAFVNRHSNQVY